MSAFNFNKIEPHQNKYLTEYLKCMGVISYVILGVNVARGDQRMYVFEWNDFMSELYLNGFSIHKDKLEKLPYNEVHKGTFNFEKIICKKDFDALYGSIDKVLEGLKEKKNQAQPALMSFGGKK